MFLPRPQYVRFNRDALLRMTATDRWNVYANRIRLAAATINEIRAEENEGPVAWGDEPYMPSFGPAPAAALLKADPTADATAQQEGTQ